MKIWEDDNQKYIKAMMEKNTTEQNGELTKRLEKIDFSVLEHIERKETVNERGVFAPLDAVEVGEIEARGEEFKETGLKAIREGKVGAVLLAGGQGTRLGLDRPKGTLNIGIDRELYLFEQLLRNLILYRQISTIPRMPLIGVRISWLILRRKSVFATFACSACSTDFSSFF